MRTVPKRTTASRLLALTLIGLSLSSPASGAPSRLARPAPSPRRIPLIDVTDLYHPHQDVGDNFDLVAAYALPELDLKAVVLDCTETFRQPVARNPGPGLAEDSGGPREPGFIPVLQLNFIFNRQVPSGAAPFTRMTSPADKMLDAPGFQQQGVELIVRTLRESAGRVDIVSFGSARPVAVAFNRAPALFRAKLRRLHLCAGASAPGFLEWNVALDPSAMLALLRADLPVALYPCAAANAEGAGYGAKNPAFSYDAHNTFYKLPDLRFIAGLDPPLRRYLEYALSRSGRSDFLRAIEVDGPRLEEALLAREHYVWETAVWICVTGRQLIRRANGVHRIVTPEERLPTDLVLPNELRPCEAKVRDDGIYEFRLTRGPSNLSVYYRGDPRANETALREALPALYLSFRSTAAAQFNGSSRPSGGGRRAAP